MSSTLNLRKLTPEQRRLLYSEVALRSAFSTPDNAICKEFHLTGEQLKQVRRAKIYKDAFADAAAMKLQRAKDALELHQDDYVSEARNSFENLVEIRNRNSPVQTDDLSRHRLSADISKHITEVAGFSAVKKSVNVDAKLEVGPEEAKLLVSALREFKETPQQILIPTTVEVAAAPVAPDLATKMAGLDTGEENASKESR